MQHAREEGIEFRMLTNPVEFLGDEKGWLTGARCVRMELGEPDARRPPQSGRRSTARSSSCPPTWPSSAWAPPPIRSSRAPRPTLKTNKRNYIVADPETMRTSKRGVFAGGDIVTGGATVILAMGAGRKAAASIHEYLTTGEW